MKVAAVKALADLAREDVPDAVIRAYGGHRIVFGPEYIIPKPLDSRVLLKVVPAVAEAAVQSGVARVPLPGRAEYVARLESLMGLEREIMRKIISTAQQNPKRIVLPEGNHSVILRAAQAAVKEGIARPLVLGNPEEIGALAQKHGLSLDGIEVLDHLKSPLFEKFVRRLFDMRKRKGWTMSETRWQMRDPYVFGAMMVHENLVDGQVHGIAQTYPNAIRPVLQVIAREPGVSTVAGLYLMIFKNRTLLFADTTVNIQPSAEVMAEIAILSARMGRFFGMTPRIAMLSFSNFGSTRNAESEKVRKAVDLALARQPDLVIDGEMQADTAVMEEILAREFPFNRLGGPANILIFPSLAAGNIAYKLLDRIGGAKAVGPLLMGISKPFNVLQRNIDMETVFNVIAITVMQAQSLAGSSGPPSR
jgi:malate dehydrogenase (oxaloacetate-decarboxylating)(NADP+)